MPAKRELTMRQLRLMLRLHHIGLGVREIGRRLHVARSTIQDNLKRAQVAGLTWPLPPDLTDEILEQRLFSHAGSKPSIRRRAEPDWAALARELKRPGVNLVVLWEEYRAADPGGYGYSRFCDLFREFEQRLSPVMRQTHVAGDKVFVDYSGKGSGSSIPPPVRYARPRSSSRCSAPPVTRRRRRPGPKHCLTGSDRMCGCLSFLQAARASLCPTI
jgi:hypothetical protein